ncbi:hypothetical protein DVR12_07725 [Chitinophaga silvatica]|uniref:Uncharacterized protein n=1 Tax=Chitinophaga silvatica TaxID=2282649 RepID=A0A3E1YEU8_9BACT|nr:hypothetical protein [Chitinophaga silvatica]RFS25065.1 hypothetical protein DVR12_07725 [Chitinophaga silvatica]
MQLTKKILTLSSILVSCLLFASFTVIKHKDVASAKLKRAGTITVIKNGQLTCPGSTTFQIQTVYSSDYSDATSIMACGGSYTSPYLMNTFSGTKTINVSNAITADRHGYYYVCAYVDGTLAYKTILQEYDYGTSYPLITLYVPLTATAGTLEIRYINL